MELKERYHFKGVLEDGPKKEAWFEVYNMKGRKERDLFLSGDQSAEQLRNHLAYAQVIDIPEDERRAVMVANLKAFLGAFKYWQPDDPFIDFCKAVTKRVEDRTPMSKESYED